jgi:hypothetical protein
VSGSVVKIAVSPAWPGPLHFVFDVDTTTTSGAGVMSVGYVPSDTMVTGQSYTFGYLQIPEPASLGLLGIGMSGLFAFRRLFRRTRVA